MLLAGGVQAHCGSGHWDGVLREPYWSRFPPHGKPPAAFWTSTLRPDGGTEWSASLPELPESLFMFRVSGRPRVLCLRSNADFVSLLREAGAPSGRENAEAFERAVPGFRGGRPDMAFEGLFADEGDSDSFWKRLMERYDAIWTPGVHEYEHGPMSSWDTESAAWFRPLEHLSLLEVVSLVQDDGVAAAGVAAALRRG